VSEQKPLPEWIRRDIDSVHEGARFEMGAEFGARLVLERLEKTRETDGEAYRRETPPNMWLPIDFEKGRESVRKEVLGE
jgi:hypothetical protein